MPNLIRRRKHLVESKNPEPMIDNMHVHECIMHINTLLKTHGLPDGYCLKQSDIQSQTYRKITKILFKLIPKRKLVIENGRQENQDQA